LRDVLGVVLGWVVATGLPVEWDAPEGCASAGEFVARVVAQAEAVEGAEFSVAVRVRQRPDQRWALVLDLEGGGGVDHREIEGETCEAVVDAAALIVALRLVEAAERGDLVPPVAPAEPPQTTPESATIEPTPAPPKTSTTPAAAIADESSRRPARPSGWIAIGAGAALGVLPSVGAGVSADGGVQGRFWRVGVSVRGFPARVVDHPTASGVRGRFDLVEAGVLGCGMPTVRRVAFPLCARVDAGALRGIGNGAVATPRPRWSPWIGVAASATVAWRIVRQVAPFVSAEGVVGALRPAYSVGGEQEPLFQAGRAGFRAWVGVEFHVQFAPRKSGAPQTQ
jgi:hypothetical protein